MAKLKNIGQKALGILKTVAPTVATALGGPFAGLAVRTLSQALTGTDDAPITAIEAALASGDGETLLAAQQAEKNFLLKMRELDIKEEELRYADVASARDREATVRDRMPMILGIAAFVQWLVVLFVVLFGRKFGIVVEPEQMSIVMFVLATAQAIVLNVFNYYFGSSEGSTRKTDAFSTWLEKQR